MINFGDALFVLFSGLLLISAGGVVFSRHSVRAVLFLIVAFFASAILWLLLQAEFLALVLLFVYVGAVMTVFLFVVMMIDFHHSLQEERYIRYLPFGLLVAVIFIGLLMWMFLGEQATTLSLSPIHLPVNYSNLKVLGEVLYTRYVFAFETSAVILLVAMVAAIGLVFRGPRHRQIQKVSQQVEVTKSTRLRVLSMKEGP